MEEEELIQSRNLKALIVDDEEDIRRIIRLTLEEMDFDCVEAVDGKQGFREATSGNYDLITMDINMPNWDGLAAATALKMVDKNIPMICISGFIDEELVQNFEKEHLQIFCLPKPFGIQDLKDIVDLVVKQL